MGIGTMADSLAAIEQVVYIEKWVTLAQLRDALKANYQGYDDLRAALLSAPKYGNNDYRADKYAVWYVEYYDKVFQKYRTPDGGSIYIAIASNTQNIAAGKVVAATPDGRLNGMSLSDAASPMHGADKKGPTAVVNSTTLPDYKLVSCGTVLNQKFSPSMFTNPENRARLAALIRTYFRKGGQEMQINAVSREMLMDAMEHPENYHNLVVRVSGFSAFYTYCDIEVQKDILARTEHR
jgi:formate C-acetyltransferase